MEIVKWNLLLPRFIYCGQIALPWFKTDKNASHQYVSSLMFLDKIKCIPYPCVDHCMQIIKKAFDKGNLVSIDNACLILAHMAHHFQLPVRVKVFRKLPDLLLTDEHLFCFMHQYKMVRGIKVCMSGGVRKMLQLWYDKFSAIQLAEMIGKHKGRHGFTHNDLIKAAHISLHGDADKLMLVQASSTRASQIIAQADRRSASDKAFGPGFQRYIDLCRLKACEPAEDYIEIIEAHNLNVEYVPTQLMSCQRLWELMLPTMTYNQLLFYLPHFEKIKMLVRGHEFLQRYIDALANVETLKEAKTHPIDIFFVKKFYRNKRMPFKLEKINYWSKNLKMIKFEKQILKNMPVPTLLNVLDRSLEAALTNLQSCGLQLFITLDVKKSALKRRIYGYQMISVLEATILLASCLYFPNKENCIIKTYSSTRNTLEPLELADGFHTSLVLASKMLKSKTVPVLATPIADAIANGLKKIDVFITISTHFETDKEAFNKLLIAINKYRDENKCDARYIFIMLCNPYKVQNFNGHEKSPILVITGLNRDTIKIINAFLEKDFN